MSIIKHILILLIIIFLGCFNNNNVKKRNDNNLNYEVDFPYPIEKQYDSKKANAEIIEEYRIFNYSEINKRFNEYWKYFQKEKIKFDKTDKNNNYEYKLKNEYLTDIYFFGFCFNKIINMIQENEYFNMSAIQKVDKKYYILIENIIFGATIIDNKLIIEQEIFINLGSGLRKEFGEKWYDYYDFPYSRDNGFKVSGMAISSNKIFIFYNAGNVKDNKLDMSLLFQSNIDGSDCQIINSDYSDIKFDKYFKMGLDNSSKKIYFIKKDFLNKNITSKHGAVVDYYILNKENKLIFDESKIFYTDENCNALSFNSINNDNSLVYLKKDGKMILNNNQGLSFIINLEYLGYSLYPPINGILFENEDSIWITTYNSVFNKTEKGFYIANLKLLK